MSHQFAFTPDPPGDHRYIKDGILHLYFRRQFIVHRGQAVNDEVLNSADIPYGHRLVPAQCQFSGAGSGGRWGINERIFSSDIMLTGFNDRHSAQEYNPPLMDNTSAVI